MLASVLCRQLMVCACLPGAALWTHPGYHQVRVAPVGTVAWTATISMPFGTPTKNKLIGAAAASAAKKRGTVSPVVVPSYSAHNAQTTRLRELAWGGVGWGGRPRALP